MLTELSIVKARLAIAVADYDELLTNAIKAVSARFDNECNRVFARAAGAIHEFNADQLEIQPASYPIESVTKFELKTNETDGWSELTGVEFLIRRQCVISLLSPISYLLTPGSWALARVTYTGGYVLPGTTPSVGQTALPDDLEQVAVEQVAAWFQHRDKLGLIRSWPHDGTYEVFTQTDLLMEVKAVLRKYERWCV